ncbi:MAG: hypothetical protein RIB47_04340 [Cyclobacteriaceae bacterium]
MEAYKEVIYLVSALVGVVSVSFLVYKFRQRLGNMEARLAGIWTNESKSLRVLFHEIDSVFQGKVIWVDTHLSDQGLLGLTIVKDLVLKSFMQGSNGVYTDPFNGEEMFFQLWLKGTKSLKLSVISREDGRVLKEENWLKINQ